MSATVVAALVGAAVLVAAGAIGAAIVSSRRARRGSGVVSAWSRHPATRPTKTVRVLRDPDEVATAADRAAAQEREAARQISDRAERISRLSQRDRQTGD